MICPGDGRKVRGFSALMRHSMAWPENVMLLLRVRQRRARRNADLLQHEVDTGDRLGHRMLHLQTGIHFDEVELAVLEQELDRSGAAILDRPHGFGRDRRRSSCVTPR